MSQTAEIDTPVVAAARPSRRRLWMISSLVVVLVGGGVIASVAASSHYLHAESLSSSGGGWVPPDSDHVRDVQAGPYDDSVVPPRYGKPQSFEMSLNNFSDVSQTVLGLTDGKVLADPQETGEPETLQISARPVYPETGAPIRYTSEPVTIPPGGQYRMRYTVVTRKSIWSCGRAEWLDSLRLQVRVGFFTRTETVDFSSLIMEIRSTC